MTRIEADVLALVRWYAEEGGLIGPDTICQLGQLLNARHPNGRRMDIDEVRAKYLRDMRRRGIAA